MNELSQQIITWLLGLLSTIITTVLLPYFVSWLKSKTESENLKYIIDEITQTVSDSVNYTNQVFVDQLKKDGKFDAEKQKEALKMSLDYTINSLTDKTKQIISKNGLDLENIIVKYIESEIRKNKN